MVGLATAWHLQEHGIHVTVYERHHVAAGSSWGNAGWLTPALTAPLPEPAVLSYGVKAVLRESGRSGRTQAVGAREGRMSGGHAHPTSRLSRVGASLVVCVG